MIRFVILEDDARYRRDLIKHLEQGGGLECVGECGTAEEAIRLVLRVRPDVVLVDLGLPGRSGIDCIRELKLKVSQGCSFLVITQHDDSERLFQALSAGAIGYCLKRDVPARLAEAIRDVRDGHGYMGPGVVRYIAEFFREPVPAEELTKAERRVLDLLKRGMGVDRIASETETSPETVRAHVKHIYDKLHVRSRAELLMRFGLKREGKV